MRDVGRLGTKTLRSKRAPGPPHLRGRYLSRSYGRPARITSPAAHSAQETRRLDKEKKKEKKKRRRNTFASEN